MFQAGHIVRDTYDDWPNYGFRASLTGEKYFEYISRSLIKIWTAGISKSF